MARLPSRVCSGVRRRLLHVAGRCLGAAVGAVYDARYRRIQRELESGPDPTSSVAVSVHAYYPEAWPLFAARLRALAQVVPHDLFVTVPDTRPALADTIAADLPSARVMLVPNHGRGTLPFIKVAQVLARRGYSAVLKLHCGTLAAKWPSLPRSSFITALEVLLPDDEARLRQMVGMVCDGRAALIGPGDNRLPLSMGLAANRRRLRRLLTMATGSPAAAAAALSRPDEHAFFAGTMFWTRLDAIEPLLAFKAAHFEYEVGLENGTLPHVLERAFPLAPQLSGRAVWVASAGGVVSEWGQRQAALVMLGPLITRP